MSRRPAFKQRMMDAVEIGGAQGYDDLTILPDGTVRMRKTVSNEGFPQVDPEPNEIDAILAKRKKPKK